MIFKLILQVKLFVFVWSSWRMILFSSFINKIMSNWWWSISSSSSTSIFRCFIDDEESFVSSQIWRWWCWWKEECFISIKNSISKTWPIPQWQSVTRLLSIISDDLTGLVKNKEKWDVNLLWTNWARVCCANAMRESGNDKVSSVHCLRWKSLSSRREEFLFFASLIIFFDFVRREEKRS